MLIGVLWIGFLLLSVSLLHSATILPGIPFQITYLHPIFVSGSIFGETKPDFISEDSEV